MSAVKVGRLYAVGVGPGDPELITVKGARLIGAADVVAYYSGTKRQSLARSIAAEFIAEGTTEELLAYPVTTGNTNHPGGYFGAMEEFYDSAADRLRQHLGAGRTVVVLAEGDPLFYSSFMYLHDRLAAQFQCEIVPGVTSVSATTAAAAAPLVRHEDVLTILPGTLPRPELARRLADTDGAAIMKLGRTFETVRAAVVEAGRIDDAVFVARASTDKQQVLPLAEVDPADVPYMSMIVIAGKDRRADSAQRHLPGAIGAIGTARPDDSAAAELLIVGLGPGPDCWVTPEVTAALAEVDHVVGYAPYVHRVPQREGLRRHPSGNTVEVDRASFALDMARRGERVAIVSGGDAGVFGMAAAVFEAAEDSRFADVPIRVLPGLSAAHAVAARAGAPMGADHAVMSLSDRLKPWAVIADRLRKVAEADLVLAIYNPRSRARPDQLQEALKILYSVRSAHTVVVVGRDVGRSGESLTVTTLGELDPQTVDMKCLLIVGNCATRVTTSGRVWSPRSVSK